MPISTIHPEFFEPWLLTDSRFHGGAVRKERHSRDSKTEKTAGPAGYLKMGFLLILHKQNSTHLHNANTNTYEAINFVPFIFTAYPIGVLNTSYNLYIAQARTF